MPYSQTIVHGRAYYGGVYLPSFEECGTQAEVDILDNAMDCLTIFSCVYRTFGPQRNGIASDETMYI